MRIRTACGSCTRVPSCLALLMSTFTQVIRARVNDNGSLSRSKSISQVAVLHLNWRKDEPQMIEDSTYAQNTLGPYQFYLLVGDGTFCIALRVGFEVTQIAYMAFTIGWSTVRLREGVDCMTGDGSQQCFLRLAARSIEAVCTKSPHGNSRYSSSDDDVMPPLFLFPEKN